LTFRLANVLRGYQPVYCVGSHLILVRGNALYRCDLSLNGVEQIGRLPDSPPILSRLGIRFWRRIFRFGIQCAALDGNDLFVARRGQVFRVPLHTGRAEIDFEVPAGRRPLNLSIVADHESGARWLCFGEYFANPDKAPVNIWRRRLDIAGHWEVAARFERNEINHIHNLLQLRDGRVVALTGDLDDAAAIWSFTPSFHSRSVLLRGSQDVRACWLWESPGGEVHYATDSQTRANSVRTIHASAEKAWTTEFAGIAGSSIYAGGGDRHVAFSSSVEPGEPTGHPIGDVFARSPGPGIVGADAVIYNLENGKLDEVFRSPKDFWPMRLAQFGTFQFPQGAMPDDRIVAYGVAVRGFDDTCLSFERVEEVAEALPEAPSILLLCTSFGREGQPRFLTDELADALVAAGAKVRMGVVDWNAPLGGPSDVAVKQNGVEAVIIAPRSISWMGPTIALASKWIFSSLFEVPRLQRRFGRARIDLTVTISPLVVTGWSLLWARWTRRSRVYAYITDFFPYHQAAGGLVPDGWISRVGLWLETFLMRRCDVVACMSPAGVTYLREHYKLSRNQETPVLRLWGNIDLPPQTNRDDVRRLHSLPLDRPVVIFGGQIIEGRGIEGVLAAAALARQSRPDLLFLFIGQGRLEPMIRADIAAGATNVILMAPSPRDEYLALAGACDIGLVSTTADTGVPTFPSKTIDYIKAGLPVVASVETTTDYRDFVCENGFGVVVDAGDQAGLLAAIGALVDDPVRRETMIQAGRRTLSEHFDVAATARKIMAQGLGAPIEHGPDSANIIIGHAGISR
jgi:glycosyltransferase involved in cell wall biosynthesis